MPSKQPKIFIVDDEPLLTEMLSDYLKESNPHFEIKSFRTGEECLRNMHEGPTL